ncbi:MAG TPA: hypothetical protein PLC79_08970 [Phycisphaerae bacterium]|nr:hypothetical protein [Phycisphaerae bacterium]
MNTLHALLSLAIQVSGKENRAQTRSCSGLVALGAAMCDRRAFLLRNRLVIGGSDLVRGQSGVCVRPARSIGA